MGVNPVQFTGSLATVRTMNDATCVPMHAMSARMTSTTYHLCQYPLT